jgi:phenylalanine-4-hydroxylase
MQRTKPLVQNYEQYTTEDFHVWRLLFDRQMITLKDKASPLYLEAVDKIGFNAYEIPDFKKVNIRMQSLTGWCLTTVPGLVPQKDFFELLAQKIFPATCWLRTLAELDYIEEPDMFHDVFGHAPLLVNPEYANFMHAFGKLALKWMHDPKAIELLGRIYWFTIEFGLLNENGKDKAFGAGIISSPGEILHATTDVSGKRPFNIEDISDSTYHTDKLQDTYFVIDSFSQLCNCIEDVEGHLNSAIKRRYLQSI